LPLAEAIVAWAIQGHDNRVLDPACGDGVFLVAAAHRLQHLGVEPSAGQLVGVEVDADTYHSARDSLGTAIPPLRIAQADFFDVMPDRLGGLFAAVVGNPPYIRYHRFRGQDRERGIAAAASAGVQLNNLSSSWAPFVIHAARFVAPGGRLALVLPAELLQVDYAGPVRAFLLQRFASVTVLTFERAIFPDALIDTVILLAEDGKYRRGLRVACLDDAAAIGDSIAGEFIGAHLPRWSALRAPGDGAQTLAQLQRAERLIHLGAIASVDIGCVTGANSFFILSANEARNLGIEEKELQPIIGRPAQLRGAIVRSSDLRHLGPDDKWLLIRPMNAKAEMMSRAANRYLEYGRTQGIDQRYKCRVRKPWYVVPGVHVPDAFLSYMSHRTPRIALNSAKITSTNLVHQIAFARQTRRWKRAYVAALYSSISLLSFELEGRSYGGGVLKLETREAERVVLPRLDPSLAEVLQATLPAIDQAVRSGQPGRASELVDERLVDAGIVDAAGVRAIRETLGSLQRRRALRGRTQHSAD
jgi:adenine-specific DNA methylase